MTRHGRRRSGREGWIALCLLSFAICECGRKEHDTAAVQAKLFEGIGAIDHRITISSEEGQKFFDQGLALIYAFNFGEAIRSFQRAAELDPNSPMPYWGIALANGPNYNSWVVGPAREQAGFDAIQSAVGLESKASGPERAYIDALACGFTDDFHPDQARLARDYAHAMREVHRRYPDDPDAEALFAASLMNLNPWHLWTNDGRPGPDTGEVVAVLEAGLRRWPEHTGLNHFYIHAMEGSRDPGRAIGSAHRLETLAPAAGHLVHMPSHIYLRTGDFAAAVRSNQQAIEADRAYRRQQPSPPPGFMAYANHNHYYLAFAASMEGDFETARNAAKDLESHAHNEAMAAMSTLVRMRFGRWDEILSSPSPDSKLTGVIFFWRLARACAYAQKGDVKSADAEQTMMEQAFSRLPKGRAFGTFFNDWSTLHTLASDTLKSRIAAARGDLSAVIASWRHAVSVQDEMDFDELPDWYYPVRESLGAALLRCRQEAEAEQVFREDLKRNPRNPRSLFGLWKALQAQHKENEAEDSRQAFAASWKGKEWPKLEDF